jgi:hypothetical protein
MGEQEENRFRIEMSDWDDVRLVAKAIKSPGLAAGIAAQQILHERRQRISDSNYADLMKEIKRPQWKTFNFWFAAIAAITGCIQLFPLLKGINWVVN